MLHERASVLLYTHIACFVLQFCGTDPVHTFPAYQHHSLSFQTVYKLYLHTSVYCRYATWAAHLNFFTCINKIITCQVHILPGYIFIGFLMTHATTMANLERVRLLKLFESKRKCISGFIFLGHRGH
jgi:hypothetical protein